jgi:hypothetical protein
MSASAPVSKVVYLYFIGRPGLGKSTVIDYFRAQCFSDILQFRFSQIQFGSGTKAGENEFAVVYNGVKYVLKDTAGFRSRTSFLETMRIVFQSRSKDDAVALFYFLPADRLERLDIFCVDFLAQNFKDSFFPVWASTTPLWDTVYFQTLYDSILSDLDIPRSLHVVLSDFNKSIHGLSGMPSELEGFRSLASTNGNYDFSAEKTCEGLPDRFLIFDVNPIYKSVLSELRRGWKDGTGPVNGADSPYAPLIAGLRYEPQIKRMIQLTANCGKSPFPDVLYEHPFFDPGSLNYGLEANRLLLAKRWEKSNRIAIKVKVAKNGAIDVAFAARNW